MMVSVQRFSWSNISTVYDLDHFLLGIDTLTPVSLYAIPCGCLLKYEKGSGLGLSSYGFKWTLVYFEGTEL